MPVGANIRIGATPADPAAAMPAEPGSIEELFAQLVASIAGPTPDAGSGDIASADPKKAPTASGEPDIAQFVEQLLDLANRQPAAQIDGVGPATAEKTAAEEAEASGPTIAASPIALPVLPIVAQPVAAKITLPNTPELDATPKAQPPQPALEARKEWQPQAPQIASSRTEAAVQQALSSLQAAVSGLPFGSGPSSQRKQHGQQDTSSVLQDLRLTPASPLSAVLAALAPEPIRASDSLQASAEPSIASDPAQILVEHQLDMAHEGEWLDQLARDIADTVASDKSPLRFRLNPETLGTLRIEITQDRNGAAVRMTADTEQARSIIADAQPRLIAEARAQGVRISEAHVDLGNQNASGDPRRQNAGSEEAPVRTARSLRDEGEGDGKPTPGRSERYA